MKSALGKCPSMQLGPRDKKKHRTAHASKFEEQEKGAGLVSVAYLRTPTRVDVSSEMFPAMGFGRNRVLICLDVEFIWFVEEDMDVILYTRSKVYTMVGGEWMYCSTYNTALMWLADGHILYDERNEYTVEKSGRDVIQCCQPSYSKRVCGGAGKVTCLENRVLRYL